VITCVLETMLFVALWCDTVVSDLHSGNVIHIVLIQFILMKNNK
jgi:hypothetical protein